MIAQQKLWERQNALTQEENRKLRQQAAAEYGVFNDSAKNNKLNDFMKIGGSESNFKKGENLDKTKAVFKSLSISAFGVYNCDQIYQFHQPVVTVVPKYLNEKKKNMTVILVYLAGEAINGIIRYDGLSGFGPNKFQFSAVSKNTLIAFDEKFRPYIFKPEQFKALSFKEAKTVEYTFEMEPLKEFQDQEQLQELFR